MNPPNRPDDVYFSDLDAPLDDYATDTDAELDPLDEEIVAYLDDELAPEERVAFERRLADDPALRARVDAERSAWNALSLLDVDAPNDRLPDAVVERLDAETQTELQALAASLRRRRALRALWLGSTALLLAALGFGLFSLFFPVLGLLPICHFLVCEEAEFRYLRRFLPLHRKVSQGLLLYRLI